MFYPKTPASRLVTCLLLLVLSPAIAFCQQFNSLSFPSPNAAELGTYGQVDVSYFNGLANISVPVYDLKVGNINIPISLSYHGGGIKKEERPTWVGLGWNLFTGGAITRITNGKIDEFYDGFNPNNNPTELSYLSNRTMLIGNNWADNGLANAGSRDLSPDEFQFNFPGNSGSFYMNEYGTFLAKSNAKYTIDYELGYNPELKNLFNPNRHAFIPRIFYKFTITTIDGTKYVFGGDKDAIEYSRPSFTNMLGLPPDVSNLPADDGRIIATTWYLKEIILIDGRKITFNYQRDGYQMIETYYYEIGEHNYNGCLSSGYSQLGHKDTWTRNLINSTYLKSIVTDEGTTVDFDFSEGQQLGNNVPLEGNNQSFNNYFDFVYEYMGNYRSKLIKLDNISVRYNNEMKTNVSFTYNNNPNQRLKLLKATFSDSAQSFKKEYSFAYNPLQLPAYNTGGADHWGYFNNDVGFFQANYLQYATARDHYNDYLAYLEPDLAKSQAEVLTQITYPTGGTSKFFYELNTYSSQVSLGFQNFSLQNVAEKNCGGLRIAKIVSDPGNSGTPIVKEYKYVKGYQYGGSQSSGILAGKPGYILDGNYNTYGTIVFFSCTIHNNFWFWSTRNYEPMSNTNGNHVTYSEVTEKFSDGSYKIYNYSNHDNSQYIDQSPTHLSTTINLNDNHFWRTLAFTKKEFERGLLLQELTYAPDNSLKRMVNYTYNTNPARYNTFIKSIETFNLPLIWNVYNELLYTVKTTSDTKTYLFNPKLTRITTYNYESIYTGALSTEQNFTYDDNWNVTEEKTVQNPSRAIKTTYTYPYNYYLNAPDASNTAARGIKELQDLKANNRVIEKLVYRQNQDGSDSKIINGQLTLYKPDAEAKAVIDKVYTLESSQPLYWLPYTYISDTYFSKDDRYTLRGTQPDNYDEKGNVLQVTKDGLVESYMWGYKKSLPIAKVQNARNNYTTTYAPQYQNGFLDMPYYNNATSFTTYYTGDISLQLSLTNSPTSDLSIFYYLSGPVTYSGNFCLEYYNYGSCYGTPNYLTIQNAPPGNYTLQIYLNTGDPGFAGVYYDYTGRQPVTTGSQEFYFDGFEEPGNWDSYLTAYDKTKSHTGRFSGRIDKPTSGEQVCSSNTWINVALNGPTKYRFSGWVYSGGPSVELFLLMKNAGETGYTTYYDRVETNVTNQWVFLEKEYTVPADVTRMNMRVDNNGGGTVWYDDIRLLPVNARMTSYTYDPLIGMTSQTDEVNRTTYYEYDAVGRLMLIRDHNKNIIKKYCYNYLGQPENCSLPEWQSTGVTRCRPCPANSQFITNIQEHQEKDNNPESLTYNNIRWVEDGPSTACLISPSWQSTSSYRCVKDYNNVNTGDREVMMVDINNCSPTYNQNMWTWYDYNTAECPLCDDYTCQMQEGEAGKCVWGTCMVGFRVVTDSYYDYYYGYYYCTYHYEYPDGSWSQNYYITSYSYCY